MSGQKGPAPHVVVIGAGFGGLFAARSLASAGVHVTLIDRSNHHLFQPLLYQVATGLLAPEDIAVPLRAIFRDQPSVRILMGEVTRIDPARRLVHVESSHLTLTYDFLIVAAGARHSYFDAPQWEPMAPGLKTLTDALEIRRRILQSYETAGEGGRTKAPVFVVAGGGPTGVELAGTLAHMVHHTFAQDFPEVPATRTRIILAEAGPRLLPMFSNATSAYVSRSLAARGVEVRTGCPVRGVSPGSVQLGSERIRATLVLWAAGNRASSLGQDLGAQGDPNGRVRVNPDLSVPGEPNVFVVGDLAAAWDHDGKPLPSVAPVAIQEGRHAAAMILRRMRGRPATPFRYRGHGQMASLGRSDAVVEIGHFRAAGRLGWGLWLTVHIMTLVGFGRRALVLMRWASAYLADQPAARILLDGPKPHSRVAVTRRPPRPSA